MHRSRILILLFSSIFSFGILNAQTKFRISAGVNISNIKIKEEIPSSRENGNIVRYFGGVYAKIPVVKKVAIESHLLYTHKGWEFKSVAPENNGSMNLHYAAIQIMSNFMVHERVGLKLGGEIGYLMKTKRKPEVTTMFKEFYNELDYGIAAGIEYRVLKFVILNINYVHGLAYVSSNDLVGDDGQNRVLQIGVAVDLF